MKQGILERLKQPSTWRGLALLASFAGVHFDEGIWDHIGSIVISAISIYEIARNAKVIATEPVAAAEPSAG